MSALPNDEFVAEVEMTTRKILSVGFNLPVELFFPAVGCAFVATYLASATEPKRDKFLDGVADVYDMLAPLAAQIAVDHPQSEKEGDL